MTIAPNWRIHLFTVWHIKKITFNIAHQFYLLIVSPLITNQMCITFSTWFKQIQTQKCQQSSVYAKFFFSFVDNANCQKNSIFRSLSSTEYCIWLKFSSIAYLIAAKLVSDKYKFDFEQTTKIDIKTQYAVYSKFACFSLSFSRQTQLEIRNFQCPLFSPKSFQIVV